MTNIYPTILRDMHKSRGTTLYKPGVPSVKMIYKPPLNTASEMGKWPLNTASSLEKRPLLRAAGWRLKNDP